MAIAWGTWARAAAVLVVPLVLFMAVVGAVDLLGPAPTPTGFYQTSLSLPLPTSCNGTGTGPPISQTSHGVNFTLEITEWCSPAGGVLNGTVIEANGTTLHFELGGAPGPSEYVAWYSPGRSCGVEWDRGATAVLLVAE